MMSIFDSQICSCLSIYHNMFLSRIQFHGICIFVFGYKVFISYFNQIGFGCWMISIFDLQICSCFSTYHNMSLSRIQFHSIYIYICFRLQGIYILRITFYKKKKKKIVMDRLYKIFEFMNWILKFLFSF